MITSQSRHALAAILLFESTAILAGAQSAPQPSPRDLIRAVVQTELASSGPDIQWKYLLEKEVEGRQETREVVETKFGSLDRLLAIAGQPLTGAQLHDELQRLLRLSRNLEEQRKLADIRKKDADQSVALLKMIPDAFTFEYSGERAGPAGDWVKLRFKPNPNFQPSGREGRVMHALAGDVWLDTKQQRLVAIEGQLLDDVKFAGGLLGHLEKGGRFSVKRTEIAQGQWELTGMDINMHGKALLFKTICVQQKELHRNFERVADDLTIPDAAALLMNNNLVAEKR